MWLVARAVDCVVHKTIAERYGGGRMNDCQIDEKDLTPQDFNTINDIVHKALRDMGIEPASFAWCIEVEYTEKEA